MTNPPSLIPSPGATALVLVDLQVFTVNHDAKPLHGQTVLRNALRLADACRSAGILVVLVRAGSSGPIRLNPPVDQSFPSMEYPANSLDFPPELQPQPGDVVVSKYNLGGFYGTDLDIQLRRRGITTILLGGLMTAYGVEGTARQANERGYAQVILSDCMSGFTEDEHANSLEIVLSRLGRIRTSTQVLAELD